jgi:hypothetical protein
VVVRTQGQATGLGCSDAGAGKRQPDQAVQIPGQEKLVVLFPTTRTSALLNRRFRGAVGAETIAILLHLVVYFASTVVLASTTCLTPTPTHQQAVSRRE